MKRRLFDARRALELPAMKRELVGPGPEVRRAIAATLDVPVSLLSPFARLVEDLGAGEMELEQLALKLESTFDIDVLDDEIPELKTVDDVVECVARHLSGALGGGGGGDA